MEIRSFSSTFNTDSLVTNELLHSFHSSVPITKGTTLPVSFSNSKQDEGCMYYVIIRRILVATVAVKNQQVLHILSVSVAAVIQHAKCMWRVGFTYGFFGCTIFFHIIS
jgi:hypothetical protein